MQLRVEGAVIEGLGFLFEVQGFTGLQFRV